jgi:hypothetical protein
VVLATAFALALACNKSSGDKESGETAKTAPDGTPSSGANAELPAAEQLLDKAVQAVGGREKLDAVKSMYSKGKASVKGQNLSGTNELWWADGDFLAIQNMPGVGTFRFGKKGDVVWGQDPVFGLRQLSGQEAEQAKREASSLMLAAHWKQFFTKAETVGTRTVENDIVFDVKLTAQSGSEVVLGISGDTGLIRSQTSDLVSPVGTQKTTIWFDDYREVDGIKLPFRSRSEMGALELESVTDAVEFNVEVDTSTFAMPSGGAEVVDVQQEKQRAMPFDADGKPGKPVPRP